MKTSYLVGLVVVIIIIAGGIWYAMRGSSAPAAMQNTEAGTAGDTSAPAPSASSGTPSASGGSASAAAPAPQSFTVNGNDETADLKTITVPAGTQVSITFGADAGSTYHGGLDFRSSVVSTGTIAPGSTKTITFTAANSFSFTPYWPATNIAKPYTIDVVVK